MSNFHQNNKPKKTQIKASQGTFIYTIFLKNFHLDNILKKLLSRQST